MSAPDDEEDPLVLLGKLDAMSHEELHQYMRDQGIDPIEVTEQAEFYRLVVRSNLSCIEVAQVLRRDLKLRQKIRDGTAAVN